VASCPLRGSGKIPEDTAVIWICSIQPAEPRQLFSCVGGSAARFRLDIPGPRCSEQVQTPAYMNTDPGDARSRAKEFNEVTIAVWKILEAEFAVGSLHLCFPPEVFDSVKALGKPSWKLIYKAVQAQAQEDRLNQLSEELIRLMKDPGCFEWPIGDPLHCLAIGIFREHANRFAAKTQEKFGLAHDYDEEDSKANQR
jgi:hypothetical protein